MQGRFHTIVWLCVALALGGCSGTRVIGSHPLVTDASAAQSAKVYFIRPQTERYLGVADNVITVEADRVPLLKLVKGEYTLARLKPGPVWVTVVNRTSWGPEHEIKEMSRSAEFELSAGGTYYLVMDAVDGEFRGVHFEPRSVDIVSAQMLTRHLRARGGAGSDPIGE